MAAPTPSSSTSAISTAISKSVASLRDGGTVSPGQVGSSAPAVAAELVAGVHNTLLANPALLSKAKGKDFSSPAPVAEGDVGSKDFWDTLGSIVTNFTPLVVDALSKDYKAPTVTIPDNLREDKDFWTFLDGAMQTVVPQVIGAITGDTGKEYQPAPPPAVPEGKTKDWFSDAMGVVGQVLPTVLPIALSFI